MIAVLFDMDGTLLDLEVDIGAVRAELGRIFRPRGYQGAFVPILPSIEAAAAKVEADPDRRESLVRSARGVIDEAETAAAARARRRPGARETLRRLASAGIDFGLITDNGRACVPVALRAAGLDDLPWLSAAVVTRDEAPPKPAPDGVVRCAERLLPRGGRLWYVGDSVRDIEAARAAGDALAAGRWGSPADIVCAALLGGRSPEGDLRSAGPDYLLQRLSELWSLEPWRAR